ncbi:biotin/lipoyl-containing protein [Kibdelosporangium persicum]|uniref:Biotin carboxyl carrier protein of acetyl-CoA carboxylase n=1 Tax=Kibdelosporangium persicum TaxID=2698649 RepID=A0ABX2FHY6_9PSEU|nr:biotin/lipoyl-containing protein [Kibdelosporangium persicum]NRN71005.1 Biotin carboxyl carrier protein of acetyl-CoA carboxylase [Kibdelosporangium persicum]
MSGTRDTEIDVMRSLEMDVARIGVEGAMDLLSRSLTEIVRAAPLVPSRARVRFGCASIEVEWPAAPSGETASTATPAKPSRSDNGLRELCTPLVGTFYRAAEPGARPFVEVGDDVEPGQQVAIVEAMKLMNAIVAEEAGRVTEILAVDGESVEYGQPLLRLEPRTGE